LAQQEPPRKKPSQLIDIRDARADLQQPVCAVVEQVGRLAPDFAQVLSEPAVLSGRQRTL
jgi:hypothetical protein